MRSKEGLVLIVQKSSRNGARAVCQCPVLHFEHISGVGSQVALRKRIGNRFLIDNGPPTDIDQDGTRGHSFKKPAVDEMTGRRNERKEKSEDVRLSRHRFQIDQFGPEFSGNGLLGRIWIHRQNTTVEPAQPSSEGLANRTKTNQSDGLSGKTRAVEHRTPSLERSAAHKTISGDTFPSHSKQQCHGKLCCRCREEIGDIGKKNTVLRAGFDIEVVIALQRTSDDAKALALIEKEVIHRIRHENEQPVCVTTMPHQDFPGKGLPRTIRHRLTKGLEKLNDLAVNPVGHHNLWFSAHKKSKPT